MDKLESLGFADTLATQKTAFKEALIPFQTGDYEKAKLALNKFLQNYPGHLEGQYYLGLSLLYLEEKLKARQVLNQLAKTRGISLLGKMQNGFLYWPPLKVTPLNVSLIFKK